MKQKFKYKPCMVEWSDANSLSGWHRENMEHDLAPCVTMGFLINKNKERILLAMNLDTQDPKDYAVGMLMAIPSGWVEKVTVLK